MSEQVRFKIEGCKVNPDLASICITFVKDENGEYVRWEDYDATCETLAHTETERDASDAEVERLKAEVERLRKAGDEMWKVIWLAECIAGVEHTEKSALAWNAAKEGKQS